MSQVPVLDIEEAYMVAKIHELVTLVQAEFNRHDDEGNNLIVDYEEDDVVVNYIKIEGRFSELVVRHTEKELHALGWGEAVAMKKKDAVYFLLAARQKGGPYEVMKTREQRLKLLEFVFNLHPQDYCEEPLRPIFKHKRSFLLGLIKISITVQECIAAEKQDRYRHRLSFDIFGHTYNVTLHGSVVGVYDLDGIDPYSHMNATL